jgi:ribosomal protein L44E
MPREGAIIFRDLVGKLVMLRNECDKCRRADQQRVNRLIERAMASTPSCSTLTANWSAQARATRRDVRICRGQPQPAVAKSTKASELKAPAA